MNKIAWRVLRIGVVAGTLGAGGASATPFTSDSIFSAGSDSLGAETSIVREMTFIDVNSGAAAVRPPCSGTSPDRGLCALPFGAFASDLKIGAAGVTTTHSIGGSTFVVPAGGYGTPVRTSLSCTAGTCVDGLTSEATGAASGSGHAPIAYAMLWTANGRCSGGPIGGQCGEDKASWSPTTIPEPRSLALIGIALAGLAFGRRRNRT